MMTTMMTTAKGTMASNDDTPFGDLAAKESSREKGSK
jgi:hypothetical protein